MIRVIAALLNLSTYHLQCLLPVIAVFAIGGLVHLYGALKGWWML